MYYSPDVTNILSKADHLMFGESDERVQNPISEIDEYETYFQRGSPFYNLLSRKIIYIHWCTIYYFMDPDSDNLYDKFDHQHTESDRIIMKCEKNCTVHYFMQLSFGQQRTYFSE